MKKIFNQIIKAVSDVTEIETDVLLSSQKSEEVVDARCILVYLCREYGLYVKRISDHSNLTVSGVRYLLSRFQERKVNNKIINIHLQEIQKQLKSNSLNGRF